jgi:hypothetical protein
MSKHKTKNYFDKFIDDQLERSQQNLDRRKLHQTAPEDDQKRNLLRLYRERVSHLIKRGTKNG